MKHKWPLLMKACVVVCALVASATLVSWPSFAADPVGPVNHYSTEDGTGGFVLDVSGEDPLMRTDGSVEIAVLTRVPGPRGDTIYKYSSGRTVLRQTNIGGMTLFDRSYPQGRPVVRDSSAQALVLVPLPLSTVKARAKLLVANLGNRIGTKLRVDVNWDAVPGGDVGAAALEDAMQIAAAGLRRVSVDPMGKEAIAKGVKVLRFLPAENPSVSLANDVLSVSYNWQEGVKGRPSSIDIADYLGETL